MDNSKKQIRVTVESSNDYDLILSALKLYVKMREVITYNISQNDSKKKGWEKLPNEERSLQVLAYFVLNGYSSDSIDDCVKVLGIQKGILAQMVYGLTKRGFLIKDRMSERKRTIPEDIQALRDRLLSPGGGELILKFIK